MYEYIAKNPGDAATWFSALGTWLGWTAIVVGLIYTHRQASRARLVEAQQNAKDTVFSQMADKWADLYKIRNEIYGGAVELSPGGGPKRLRTLSELAAAYKDDPNYKEFLNDPGNEWRVIRPLCNYFERIGLAVEQGVLDKEMIFVLVSIDTPNEDVAEKLAPYINYIRGIRPGNKRVQAFRDDLYIHYDYLFLVWLEHTRKLPKHNAIHRERGGHLPFPDPNVKRTSPL